MNDTSTSREPSPANDETPGASRMLARDVCIARAAHALQRGENHLSCGHHDAASRAFVEALDMLSGHSSSMRCDAALGLARAYIGTGRFVKAERELQRSLESDPDHAPTMRELAELHVAQGEFAQADEIELRIFATSDCPFERAVALLRSGDRWWARGQHLEGAWRRYRQAAEHAVGYPMVTDIIDSRLRAVQALRAIKPMAPRLRGNKRVRRPSRAIDPQRDTARRDVRRAVGCITLGSGSAVAQR